MGSIFLVGGTKGKRYALPNSRVMIHQPSHGAQGMVTDTRIAVEEGMKLKKNLTQIIADGCGQPFEKVEQDMERDKWLSPQDALAYGLIDHIL